MTILGGIRMDNWKRRSALLTMALITVVAMIAAACGGSGSSSSSSGGSSSAADTGAIPAVQKDDAIAAMVPADIASKGSLTVATDATYPPAELFAEDGQTIEGMDIDLGTAIGEVMGVKWNFVNAGFDTIIPGIQAKKYDVGMSAFTDTKEREKVIDFITYFTAGTSFMTSADGGPTINSIEDVCGLTVAYEKGSTSAEAAIAQGKKCVAAGKQDVKAVAFPDQNAVNLAVASKQADFAMADTPTLEWIALKSDGKLKVVGTSFDDAPYGIAVPKDGGLAQPTLEAIKKLMADGTYAAILKKWGVESGAITDPGINKAIF
ncbi:MAG: ABC transporter substrate-binding protein [Gaiellales bacterium]